MTYSEFNLQLNKNSYLLIQIHSRETLPIWKFSVIMHQSQGLTNAGGMSKNLGVQVVP